MEVSKGAVCFLGPLVVGIWAFFFLVGMVWVRVGILLGVDVERGRRDVKDRVYDGGRSGLAACFLEDCFSIILA
ncbi:hypothetical protein P691DRAFT_55679 [Macrolepiota fuliginosa MF-IS2]|uniref:Uncharacterized protein n=1 Tax=Macrolepiota fuliginosa MF-IS2 TaxID=1400762 RepID=A0A9P6BWX1_9AGAR|nr:hypothetical protein P691DRAFT_55679 [Macrolepiota fuliginosa MF-IS2]